MDADNLDHAATVTQEATDRSINAIRQQAAKIDISNPSGECLFCGESVGVDRRWCDSECRDMYQKGEE